MVKPPYVIFFVPRRRPADCYIFHSNLPGCQAIFLNFPLPAFEIADHSRRAVYTEFQQSERPLSPADIRLHNEYHITLLQVVLDKKKNTYSDIKPEQKLHSQPAWEADGELNF